MERCHGPSAGTDHCIGPNVLPERQQVKVRTSADRRSLLGRFWFDLALLGEAVQAQGGAGAVIGGSTKGQPSFRTRPFEEISTPLSFLSVFLSRIDQPQLDFGSTMSCIANQRVIKD
jgi:hypothetical protein